MRVSYAVVGRMTLGDVRAGSRRDGVEASSGKSWELVAFQGWQSMERESVRL